MRRSRDGSLDRGRHLAVLEVLKVHRVLEVLGLEGPQVLHVQVLVRQQRRRVLTRPVGRRHP